MPLGIAARAFGPTINRLEGESMTARHWMQIAALTSALGLTGAAIAQDTNATTTTDSSSLSSYWMDTPSSGAIVTPADKAAGMGKGDDQASTRNGDVDEGASASSRSSDDTLSVNPGPSKDEDSSVSPPSSDDEMSVYPGNADRDDNAARYGIPSSPSSKMNRDRAARFGDESAPAKAGSDVQPDDIGPGGVPGE